MEIPGGCGTKSLMAWLLPDVNDGTGTPASSRRLVEQQRKQLPRGLPQQQQPGKPEQQQRVPDFAYSCMPGLLNGNSAGVLRGVQICSGDCGDAVQKFPRAGRPGSLRRRAARPFENIFEALIMALLLFTVFISRLKIHFLWQTCFTSGRAINA